MEFVDYNGNDVNIRPIQLLKNNDFLINQREETSYNFNKNGKYGLDMWQHRQGNYYTAIKVEQISGGGAKVTLGTNAGGGLRQYIECDSSYLNKKYTASINVDNKIYSKTITLTDSKQSITDNDIFLLEVWYDKNDYIIYSIWFKRDIETYPTSEVHNIYYGDLFVGDILFPHKKENKNEAKLRCMHYVYRVESMMNGFLTWGERRNSVINFKINLQVPFYKTPTIEYIALLNGFIYSNATTSGSDLTADNLVRSLVYYNTSNNIIIQYHKKDNTSFPIYDYWTFITVLFTCEPVIDE